MSQITDITFPEAEGEGYDKSAVNSYLQQLDEFVRDLGKKHQDELTSSTRAEEIAQSSRLIAHANEVSEQYLSDARAKADALVAEAETKADKLIDDSADDADLIRGEANKELEVAKVEAAKIVDDAKESVSAAIAKADAEAERARNITAETQAKIDEVVNEAKKDAEFKHNEAVAKAEEIVREADAYAAQTRSDALDLKNAVQEKAEEFLNDAQANAQNIVAEATAEAEKVLADAHTEHANRLKHLQEEIDRSERLVAEFTEYREKTASRLLDFYTQQAAVLAEFAAPADSEVRPAQEVTASHVEPVREESTEESKPEVVAPAATDEDGGLELELDADK
jgi:vacuolar-type H+-ATPase subunit H